MLFMFVICLLILMIIIHHQALFLFMSIIFFFNLIFHFSQAGFGNNCAHCAKSLKLGRNLVQYVSFDFFVDQVF